MCGHLLLMLTKSKKIRHEYDLMKSVILKEPWSVSRNLVRLGVVVMLACIFIAVWSILKGKNWGLILWGVSASLICIIAVAWAARMSMCVSQAVRLLIILSSGASEECSDEADSQ